MTPEIEVAKAVVPWQSVVQSLTDSLGRVAPELGQIIGSLPRTAFGLESGFFYLPIAQAQAWQVGTSQFLHRLGTTFGLGHLYYVLHDRLLDLGALSPCEAILQDAVLTEYLFAATELGIEAGQVLSVHRDATALYSQSLIRDIELRRAPRMLTATETFGLGDKAAPASMALFAIANASNRIGRMPDLRISLRWLCTGLQLLDDLEDIVDDVQRGHCTLPVALSVRTLGIPRPWNLLALDPEYVTDACYIGGGARATLRLSIIALQRAIEHAMRAKAFTIASLCTVWSELALSRLSWVEKGIG